MSQLRRTISSYRSKSNNKALLAELNINLSLGVSREEYKLVQQQVNNLRTEYKQIKSKQNKENKEAEKRALYEEACDYGWSYTYRSSKSSLKKLREFIEENKPEIIFEEEADVDFEDDPQNEKDTDYRVHIRLFSREIKQERTEDHLFISGKRIRANTKGVRYTKINNKYYQEIVHEIILDVKTKFRIEDIYVDLPIHRQIYELPRRESFTNEFNEFLMHINVQTMIDPDNLNMLIRLIQSSKIHASYISILQIHRDMSDAEVPDEHTLVRRTYTDSSNSKFICDPYIVYPYSFTEAQKGLELLFTKPYVQETIQKSGYTDCCVLDVIMAVFKPSWDKYQDTLVKPQYLTYEFLIDLFGITSKDDLALNIDTVIEKFFKRYHLNLHVYNRDRVEIASYVPPSRNKKITGTCNVIATNGHFFHINFNLNSLSKTKQNVDDWKLTPSSLFYIRKIQSTTKPTTKPKKKRRTHENLPRITRYFKTIEEIVTIDYSEPKHYTIIVETPLEYILYFLRKKLNYTPCISRHSSDPVSSITIRPGESIVTIKNPQNDRILGELSFESEQQYMRYEQLSSTFSSKIISRNNLSYYSGYEQDHSWINTAKSFCPLPLIGCVDKTITPNYVYDFSKFYTSLLMVLPFIPVVGGFDCFRVYSDEQPKSVIDIDSRVFYVIERTVESIDCPRSLLPLIKDKQTIYPGFVFKQHFTELIPYTRISYISSIANVDKEQKSTINAQIKKIYDDELLSAKQKKAIVNFVIGFLEKTENRDSRTALFDDQFEAIEYSKKVDGQAFFWCEKDFELHNDQSEVHPLLQPKAVSNAYIVSKKASTPLCNGFYPIKLCIYALARSKMYDLHVHIENTGGIVHSYKTDAMYFYSDKPLKEVQLETSFANIGKLTLQKVDSETMIPVVKMKDYTTIRNKVLVPFTPTPIVFSTLQNEDQWETNPEVYTTEARTLLDSWKSKRIMIMGSQFGVGKTRLITDYLKTQIAKGKKVVVSAPTNKRVSQLRLDFPDDNCCRTIHSLLRVRMDESNEEDIQEIEASNVDTLGDVEFLFIDEIYMLSTKTLYRLNGLFKKYPSLTVIGTGDVNQQRISDINIKAQNSYYEDCMTTMFTVGLCLNINKRFKNPRDRENIALIKDSLYKKEGDRKEYHKYVNTFKKIDQMLDIVFKNGVFNAKLICYFVACRTALNVRIHRELINRSTIKNVKSVGAFELYPGLILSAVSRLILKPRIIQLNELVEVVSVDKNFVTVQEYDEDTIHLDPLKFMVPRSYFDEFYCFRYTYCDTAIATQGDTYTDCPVLLFDTDSRLMESASIYTSIGRATSLNNVFVYTGGDITVNAKSANLTNLITTRIRLHVESDKKAKRKFDPVDYIDEQWIYDQLDTQEKKCHHCKREVSMDSKEKSMCFSVDRVDNRFAHSKTNCVISCRRCNLARCSELQK